MADLTGVASPDDAVTTRLTGISASARSYQFNADFMSPATPIQLQVVALNGAGASVAGSTQTLRVAAEPSSPVTRVVATAADRALRVTWAPPRTFLGGRPLSVTATAMPGDHRCVVTDLSGGYYAGCTLDGLTSRLPYAVTVAITTTVGTTAADPVVAAPSGALDAPGRVGLRADRAGVHVGWVAGGDGSAADSYRVDLVPTQASIAPTISVSVSGAARSADFPSVLLGVGYQAVVTAVLADGESAAARSADAVAETTDYTRQPNRVAGVGVTGITYHSVRLFWVQPPVGAGQAIDRYELRLSRAGATRLVRSTDRVLTVRRLVAGRTYHLSVRAHNAAGWGSWSPAVRFVTRSRH
jgi:hypothetical protein